MLLKGSFGDFVTKVTGGRNDLSIYSGGEVTGTNKIINNINNFNSELTVNLILNENAILNFAYFVNNTYVAQQCIDLKSIFVWI